MSFLSPAKIGDYPLLTLQILDFRLIYYNLFLQQALLSTNKIDFLTFRWLFMEQIQNDKVSVENRYFIHGPLNRNWLHQAVTQIESLCPHPVYFSGDMTVRTTNSSVQQVTYSNQKEWTAAVTSQWEQLTDWRLWIANEERRLVLYVDLQRLWITLQVQTDSRQRSLSLLAQLQKEWNLSPSSLFPYRYRKISGTYLMKFHRERFAEAFQAAMNSLCPGDFPMDRLAIREAYATEKDTNGNELLYPFITISSLLAYIRDEEKQYRRLGIGIEAPNGIGLGISINDDHSRLEIRSSLAKGKFDDLVSLFQPLSLKPIESPHTGSGIAVDPPVARESWWKRNTTIIVALIGLISLSGLISLFYFFRPSYELQIMQPAKTGDTAVITSRSFLVSWYLVPNVQTFKAIDYHSPAMIQVIREGRLFARYPRMFPDSAVQLPPGTYTVWIVPQDNAVKPGSFTVVQR